MKVLYKEMFPDEFKAALEAQPLAYLPLGAMEFHGWHNVLGLDSIKAERVCELAAQKTGGVVLPALSIGYDLFPDADPAKHANKQYDTYSIDPGAYQELLEQYFRDIFKSGFKKVLVLAGHYPNKDIALLAAKKFPDYQIWVKTEADLAQEDGDHAGKWETSLMMALFPAYVEPNRGERRKDKLLAVVGEDPALASAAYGREALDKIISAIQQLVG